MFLRYKLQNKFRLSVYVGMAMGRIGADMGIIRPDTRNDNPPQIRPDPRTGRGETSHTRTKRGSGNPRTEWIPELY